MSTPAENEATVRAFFATWGNSFEDLLEGFRTYVAEDCLLRQTKTPDLHGVKEIIPFLEHVRDAGLLEKMQVEVINVVAAGNKVAVERTDVMHGTEGEAPNAHFPTTSFMELDGGKIIGWRDYFDSADMPSGGIDIVNQKIG